MQLTDRGICHNSTNDAGIDEYATVLRTACYRGVVYSLSRSAICSDSFLNCKLTLLGAAYTKNLFH